MFRVLQVGSELDERKVYRLSGVTPGHRIDRTIAKRGRRHAPRE